MEQSEEITFHCNHGGGFSSIVRGNSDHITVQKKARDVLVEFAIDSVTIHIMEGSVIANQGDAIITGSYGERWPIFRERFLNKYHPVPPTLLGQSGKYRSRPRKLSALKMKV